MSARSTRSTRLGRFARTAIAAAIAVCGAGGRDVIARAGPAPISGGNADTTDVAVGLVVTPAGMCSGTLIAPTAVLTAGHCADALPISVELDDGSYAVTAIARHPAYNVPAPLDNDLAVLALDHASSITPLPIAGVALVAGDAVLLVGFGRDASGDSGTRRAGASTIAEVTGARFAVDGTPNACGGDSGGAVLLATGGAPAIGGVISSGATDCGAASEHVRLAAYLPWLATIAPAAMLAAGGPLPTADAAPTIAITRPGDGATMPDEFSLGVTTADDYGALAITVAVDGVVTSTVDVTGAAQSVALGIPPGAHTLTITTTDDLGRVGAATVALTIEPPIYDPRTPGAACWDDSDCDSAQCAITGAAGGERYCTIACASDDACPSGLTCEAHACAPGERGGGGCAAAPSHGPGGAAWLALAWCLLVFARRRGTVRQRQACDVGATGRSRVIRDANA